MKLFSHNLCAPPFFDQFQKFIDKNFGEHDDSLLSAIAECVPYIGPFLKRVVSTKTAQPIYSGDYPSAVEAFLVPFFTKSANSTVITIIIDQAQNLSESSFELLNNLIISGSIRCILIITNEQASLKLINYMYSYDTVWFEVEFDQPQIKLVKEIAKLYGLLITSQDAEQIAIDTHHNIHKIINAICSYGKPVINMPLSEWERAIISIIHIFGLPMEIDKLTKVIMVGPAFAPNPNIACQEALQQLIKRRLIAQQDDAYILDRPSHPLVSEVLKHKAEQLVYANMAYEYLCKNNKNDNLGLRYQLSKQLEFTQREDALPYMHKLVTLGEYVSTELFADAQLKKGCRYDCILAGVKFCRERKYSEALEWVSSIPDNDLDESVTALKATLLNRTRNTKLAEEALLECLKKDGSLSRKNLLGAFLISNYIHAEELTKAQKVFESYHSRHAHTPMHGYLIRNAASAYKANRDDIYEAAISAFKEDADYFGYYTTMCNWGYSQCIEGKYEEALKMLQESKNGLECFPKTDMHIIYNNLGICSLLMGNFTKAYSYLSLAQKLGQTSMPKIFASINLACTQAVSGDTSSAIKTLNAIEPEVEAHLLDRVRQKYYPNRIMVEYLNNNKELTILIDKTNQYLDRYHPEQTLKSLQMYKRFSNSKKTCQKHLWRELYSPCGLAYWYMDPLKLFSEGVIY